MRNHKAHIRRRTAVTEATAGGGGCVRLAATIVTPRPTSATMAVPTTAMMSTALVTAWFPLLKLHCAMIDFVQKKVLGKQNQQ